MEESKRTLDDIAFVWKLNFPIIIRMAKMFNSLKHPQGGGYCLQKQYTDWKIIKDEDGQYKFATVYTCGPQELMTRIDAFVAKHYGFITKSLEHVKN